MQARDVLRRAGNIASRGGILVFFLMAFEVMIMISPFAFFFYSIFNPALHWLDRSGATRWLTSFFLPHMILPPTLFLRAIRVTGSVLVVLGCACFVVCAFQVYLGRIFGRGIAHRGLYRFVRHPQYLALGLWGMGMTILWPRFLVLAALAVMFILYSFLAKDEERRMLEQFDDSYRQYMARTGMFLPRTVEDRLSAALKILPRGTFRAALLRAAVPIVLIGSGCLLREVTLRSLRLETGQNLTLVSILPEDAEINHKVLAELLSGSSADSKVDFLNPADDYLGYVMQPDYVMQGMIADTGAQSHLHKQQHTFALITDWVLNPFEHLRRSPVAEMAKMHGVDPRVARRHHCPLAVDDQTLRCGDCPFRRVIFVRSDLDTKGHLAKAAHFALGIRRVPVGWVDINTETGEIMTAKTVEKATAWQDVPTPAI